MWYESQIFAVVVGAFLGFVLSYVPTRIERYRQRRALQYALLVEVRRIVTYLADRRATYLRYRNMVSQGGRLGIYTTDRSLDIVYRANVGNIASLRADVVTKLVEFYEGVNEFGGRIRALSSSLQKFHAGSDPLTDQSFFVGGLDRIIEVIDRTVECGNRLLNPKQPNPSAAADNPKPLPRLGGAGSIAAEPKR